MFIIRSVSAIAGSVPASIPTQFSRRLSRRRFHLIIQANISLTNGRARNCRPPKVQAFAGYLQQRRNDGCHSATRMHNEIRATGYTANVPTVARFVLTWTPNGRPHSPPAPETIEPKPAQLHDFCDIRNAIDESHVSGRPARTQTQTRAAPSQGMPGDAEECHAKRSLAMACPAAPSFTPSQTSSRQFGGMIPSLSALAIIPRCQQSARRT